MIFSVPFNQKETTRSFEIHQNADLHCTSVVLHIRPLSSEGFQLLRIIFDQKLKTLCPVTLTINVANDIMANTAPQSRDKGYLFSYDYHDRNLEKGNKEVHLFFGRLVSFSRYICRLNV